jgi:hypothetical protein
MRAIPCILIAVCDFHHDFSSTPGVVLKSGEAITIDL